MKDAPLLATATRLVAACALALSLAACGAGASASGGASSASTLDASQAVYENEKLGISYAPPTGYVLDQDQNQEQPGMEFTAQNEEGNSVSLMLAASGDLDVSTKADLDSLSKTFVSTLQAQGVEGVSVDLKTLRLSNGLEYPAAKCFGTLAGVSIAAEQLYYQRGDQLAIFTAFAALNAGDVDSLLSNVVIN